MGDCRIRFVIATTGNEGGDATTTTATSLSSSSAQVYSSDTTVREVIESHVDLWQRLSSSDNTDGGAGTVFTLWDCTLHPPKDITSWPFEKYPALQGPSSLTCFDAGWFPSAILVCLPRGVSPAGYNNKDTTSGTTDPYADEQYNTTTKRTKDNSTAPTTTGGPAVQFRDTGLGPTSKPSQVMASVSQRFAAEEEAEAEALKAKRQNQEDNNSNDDNSGSQQRKKYLEMKNRQRERAMKLDQRIAALEEETDKKKKKQKKGGGVSQQVLRMLVKSRATGDDRLKIQDRLYFQCLLMDPDDENDNDDDHAVDDPMKPPSSLSSPNTTKEYRYFSPQDTFARIGGSFELTDDGQSQKRRQSDALSSLWTEVLCRIPSSSSGTTNNNKSDSDHHSSSSCSHTYRRFPVTMRVYEAISKGFLNDQIDTLIIRWYKDRNDATSLSVNDVEDDIIDGDNDAKVEISYHSPKTSAIDEGSGTWPDTVKAMDATSSPSDNDHGSNDYFTDTKLSQALQRLDGATKKSSKKSKSSSSSVKVRQMKIKSKASGDAKRIKMDDRFFLEVVIIVEDDDDDGAATASNNFYYLARKDPVERILLYINNNKRNVNATSSDWEFLVQQPGSEDFKFKRITDTSKTMMELEADGNLLKSFDRLILRRST